MYRYHTLPAARDKAAAMGYRGALYAWESADTGEETTPEYIIEPTGLAVPILTGLEQHHISADIAYAVWQYWLATGDDHFLRQAGAEIILETARFWASRSTLEEDNRYHIRRVIGPDEYHESVDDNAYTNVMAQWNLERSAEVAALLRERWPDRWQELADRLEIAPDEPASWLAIADKIYTGFDPTTGLIEQFAGYFELETIDLSEFDPRKSPITSVLSPDRIRQSQIIKQPDVVMLMALFPERYPREVQLANFRFYEPRCVHGSSLSRGIHALVAARLGERDLAESYFRQTMGIDLEDTTGTGTGGIHIAALGGLWQAFISGFVGLHFDARRLRFDPDVLPSWQRITFGIQWRERQLHVELIPASKTLTATLESGEPMALEVGNRVLHLESGQPLSAPWEEPTSQQTAEPTRSRLST